MKKENNILQMVISGLLSAVFVFLLMGRGEKVIIVNNSSQVRAPVVMSGIIPDFNDGINWAHYVFDDSDNNDVLEPDFSFVSDDVIEIIDGDTFTVMLDLPDFHEKTECKIRLAGVNCPEQFDQVCYANAKEFTSKFFLKEINCESEENGSKESANKRIDTIFSMYLVDTDKNNRPVAFIENNIGEDLGKGLIDKQYAIPCPSYLFNERTRKLYLPFAKKIKEYVKEAADEFQVINTSEASVWGEDPINSKAKFKIIPYRKDVIDDKSLDKKSKEVGDSIQIVFESPVHAVPKFSFSGYSILDENSYYTHRFFVPKIIVGFDEEDDATSTPSITIRTGSTYEGRMNWRSDASIRPTIFMMGDSNWVCDQGELVFLRNPNRRIVSCALWTPYTLIKNKGKDEYIISIPDKESKNSSVSEGYREGYSINLTEPSVLDTGNEYMVLDIIDGLINLYAVENEEP